ncbi:MAG: formate dehydrogenase [Bacteriovoracaceae bacterium]|jgi:NADH-quinone oxidoreductase subunit F|nr:formate dehydrogenase [Bacteriovoracaceae bacterium]
MSNNLSFLAKKNGLKHSIAEKIHSNSALGDATTFGANSFYDFLKPGSEKVKARLCNGTACLMGSENQKIKSELLKSYDQSEIGHVSCLGHCGRGNSYMVGDEVISLSGETTFNDARGSEGILLGPQLPNHKISESIKLALTKSSGELLEEVKKSGIRGRGGAGFPMAFKLTAASVEQSCEKYVVCNADEGDPGSYSDKYLLENRPDLVLFGLMISAKIIGASTGILYIRAEYPNSMDMMIETIKQWEKEGFLGDNILGTGFNFQVFSIVGAGSYVCGEETALLSSLEGQRAEVRIRPPYPTTRGLFNQPTVVNNVETLSNLYHIITSGGESYRELGTPKSTGVKLISLSGLFNTPGVYEVEMGTSLGEIVNNIGFKTKVKALQVGGPLGGIIPISMVDKLTIDFESFKEGGFLLGHGSIVAIPESFAMIKYIEHLLEFTSDESCGKCVPCRMGSTRGHELIKKSSSESIDVQLFDDLLETMELGSLCALGGGISLPIKNIIQYFPNELSSYFKGEK